MIPLCILRKITEEECLVAVDSKSHIYKHITSEYKLTKAQTNIQLILMY